MNTKHRAYKNRNHQRRERLYSANGNACETYYISRFHAFPTAADQVARKPPNAPIAHPSSHPPSPFSCLPRVRAMPRRFHTREYSKSEIDTALESATVLSRDASRVSMACLRSSKVDVVWRWNSRGISKAPRIYSLLHCWAWSATYTYDTEHEKQETIISNIIYLLYINKHVELISAWICVINSPELTWSH